MGDCVLSTAQVQAGELWLPTLSHSRSMLWAGLGHCCRGHCSKEGQPWSHLRAAGQGVEEIEKHKTSEGHRRGAGSARSVFRHLEGKRTGERLGGTRHHSS